MSFAGLIHPGLIGCLPDQKLLETWNEREQALIATNPTRVPPLANPPFAATAHCGRAKGDVEKQDRRRGRPHGAAARARRQLRHQGSVARLEDLLPGLCEGRRPLHGRPALQPGRRRDHLLRRHRDGGLAAPQGRAHQGGVAKYGIKNPIFKPSPITPNYKDYLIFEGISVDEQGKQHYLDVHIAYRQACLNAIEYLKKFGYSRRPGLRHPRHGAGAGPYHRRGRHPQCLRHAVAADRDLRFRHHAGRRKGRSNTSRAASTFRCRPTNDARRTTDVPLGEARGRQILPPPHPPEWAGDGGKPTRKADAGL